MIACCAVNENKKKDNGGLRHDVRAHTQHWNQNHGVLDQRQRVARELKVDGKARIIVECERVGRHDGAKLHAEQRGKKRHIGHHTLCRRLAIRRHDNFDLGRRGAAQSAHVLNAGTGRVE